MRDTIWDDRCYKQIKASSPSFTFKSYEILNKPLQCRVYFRCSLKRGRNDATLFTINRHRCNAPDTVRLDALTYKRNDVTFTRRMRQYVKSRRLMVRRR